MRFIQNILHLLQCRPPSASGNHRLSWSESPNWFLSMPSLALFSTIPSSGVASSMLFLRESTRWSSREGSSPVNSEAIRRLGCANEGRLRWNPDSFREESLGPHMPCVPGPRPVGRSTHRRVSLDHSFSTLDVSWASCSFFPLSVVIASGFLKTFYSLPYSWFIYAKKSPNFSFSSSAFMHSNNSCSEFLHSCCKNKFYIKIRYYNCKKAKKFECGRFISHPVFPC